MFVARSIFKTYIIPLVLRSLSIKTFLYARAAYHLGRSRAAEAEKQLAKIQDMVEILLKSRKDVKEILVVLGNDDPRADFVLSDRTSHNQRLQSSPQDNQQEKSSEKQVHPMAYQPTAEEIAAKQLAACKTWYDSSNCCLKVEGNVYEI